MKKLLLLFVFLSCSQQKESPLQSYFSTHNIPAAFMSSVDKGGKISSYAFGPSRWGGKDTVNGDNIFRIYSMTKAIASVGVMQLVEKGLLTLDAPLNSLMPEMDSIPVFDGATLSYRHDTITLRHLLTHTSGFGYRFTSAKLAAFHPEKWIYKDDPRLFKSGRGWHYGTSTDWVGRVIEKVSGKDLETYLRDHVTGPLGMTSTWFNVPANLQDNIVTIGTRDTTGHFTEYPRVPDKPVTEFSAGGGLFGSPNDYLRFLRCMLNKGELEGVRVLKAETVSLMLKDNLPKDVSLHYEISGGLADSTDRWGLAWALEANPAEKIRPAGTAYWAGAANSFYTLDVENGIAVVYFSNFFPMNDSEAYELYRLMEGEAYERSKR